MIGYRLIETIYLKALRVFGFFQVHRTTIGFTLGLLAAADVDDEGGPYWEKIPEWEKARNLIIMTGGGDRVTIPAPYGYGWFIHLGYALADMYRHKGRNMGSKAMELLGSFLNHYSPINAESFTSAITPTLLDPWVEIDRNLKSSGTPVMPDSKRLDGTPIPDAQRYWSATKGSPFEILTSALSQATGGTQFRAGTVDISPESLRLLAKYYTGGAGTFIDDSINSVFITAMIGPDAAVDKNAIPFLKTIYKKDGVRSDQAYFYENRGKALAALAEAKNYDGDDPKVLSRIQSEMGFAALGQALHKYNKALKGLAMQEREARQDHANGKLTARQLYDAQQQIDLEKRSLLRDWNGQFYKETMAQ